MVDSHSALTQRHKASLQSFIDKNDWIQNKIDFLERSTLPAIDAESSSLDNDALSQLLQEHERLEAEVQDLDNGELRALRLLAKAASSHKNLSPEDTDLIEITLKVLFSVDKLLHLLRIRGKELYLIQLKNKWTTSIKNTEADCHSILHEVLPRFINKARWKEPQDSQEYERRQARLSNASVASAASKQASPSSIRTTMTNSSMARQMRAEILSLDLAALASRIHTLSHSTLAAKILDKMVDASPVPLSESFLDLQDEFEARSKRDLSGIVDFCHALTSQLKQIDQVHWICRDLRLSSEVLARDIEQATLKLPSEVLTDTFQGRLQALLSRYDTTCIQLVSTLPTPLLQAQVPDQAMHNQQVVDILQLTTRSTSVCLDGCRQAVEAYRNAAQAFATAQAYHAHINEALATIRQHVRTLKRIPFDVSTVSTSDVDLDTVADSMRALSQIAEDAQENIDSKSQNIILDLLNAGIDPNVRRSLQESISALQRDAKQALHLSRVEDGKLVALDQLRKTLALLTDDRNQLLELENTLTVSIEETLDRESESEKSPRNADELSAKTISLSHQIAEDLESCSCAKDSLGRLSASLSDEVPPLQQYLQRQTSQVQEQANNVQDMLDLLQRALAQRKETESARNRAIQLQGDLDKLRTVLSSATLDTIDPKEVTLQQEKLSSRFKAFKESLVADVSFLSRSSPGRKFDLISHDRSVRIVLNDLSTGLESSIHQTAREVKTLRKALEAKKHLQADKARLEVIVAQGEGVRSSIDNMSGERLKQLEKAKTDILLLLEGCTEFDKPQIEGVDRTQASRDLADARTSLSVQKDTAVQTLNSMICHVETNISAEKARQVAAEAEEEQERTNEARRAVVEAASRANIAKLGVLEASARVASASAATMLEHLQNIVWTGLDSDQHRLEEYRNQVEAYRLQTDALQKEFSLVLDQYVDSGISVNSSYRDHRNVRVAAVKKAVDDSLRAAVDLQEAEEKALAMYQAAVRRQEAEQEAGERSIESDQMEFVPDPLQSVGTERVLLPNVTPADLNASQTKEVEEKPNLPRSPAQQDLDREALISDLSIESNAAFPTSEDVFGPRLSTFLGVEDSTASTSSVSTPSLLEAALDLPKGGQTVADAEHSQEGTLTSASEDVKRTRAPHSTSPAPSTNTEDNDVASVISAFEKAAAAADEAISRTMDLVDDFEENADTSTSLGVDTDQVQHRLLAAKNAAVPLGTDSCIQSRLLHLQNVWHGLQEHIDSLQEQCRHAAARSTSLSRASSSSSVSKTSRRSASSRVLSHTVSDRNGREYSRACSVNSSSRLPIAAFRARKQSLTSTPTTTLPAPSRLPRPMSASSKTFHSPTVASPSRKPPTKKHYNALSPFGVPRLPTPISSRGISTQAKEELAALPSPRRHRTSNRRSSAGHSVDLNAKPNSYRPKPNHKLDIAVGKIVNNMPVPVTVTPAEVHRDEVGKYWIGDPPRLYYARILRSRTVMLRVGGGWQELGSFLSTHFDQIFTTGEGIYPASEEVGDHGASTPRVLDQHRSPGDVPWLSSSAMKTSQSNFSSRRESFRSPRSASVHISPLNYSHPGGELPFDLTALLMKSVSRSPPVHRSGTSQRNVSAPMPWKI